MHTKNLTNKRVKIAIVGCGRISLNHIKSILTLHSKSELVAICDNNSERIIQAKKNIVEFTPKDLNYDISSLLIFNEFSDLINEARNNPNLIDLVVLATPSGLHSIQTIEAAKANLHVCTEKPMATTWNDGLAMTKACTDAGVKLFVVKQNRFNSTLQLVKRQIEENRFGQIAMVTVNVFWQRPQSYYDQDQWRGTKKLDGGALMNQSSHYVDLLDWLVGPVLKISASTATLGRDIESEDTAAIQLQWENGALGTMAVTMLTYPKNLEGSITILGEKGSVRVGGPAVNKIEFWQFEDNHPDDKLIETASYETTSVYGFGHPAYYSNMLDTLLGQAEAICDGSQGLKSLELLTGAYLSAKENRVVTFPLKS